MVGLRRNGPFERPGRLERAARRGVEDDDHVKLHFLGANRQVTGSKYCLEAAGVKLLIDCGMFQERPFLERNWAPCPIPPEECQALAVTHAHIDHSGWIPKLVGDGYRGPIYTTRPTAELLDLMLRDSAHIQMEDAAYKKKRHAKEGRRGKYPEKPLYTTTEVEQALPLLHGVPYRKPVDVGGVFSITFHDAGHILGSAMLDIVVTDNGTQRRIIFSGDIGQPDKPFIRDPSFFEEADYVVMESTYGDRDHERAGDIESNLGKIINDTVQRGGNVVIPTFAVERAQELMYYISRLVHADAIPDLKIFLDSPMAADVTEIFRHFRDCFDEETWDLIRSNEPPLRFPGMTLVRSVEESKAINEWSEPCVIMATSGMCTAGRIKHHLRRNISRPESTILFVGYQGRETLGRRILDGQEPVRIHGRMHRVAAEIAQLHGLSGHADRAGLLGWLGRLRRPPRRLFLTHGEEESSLRLAERIERDMGWPVATPRYRDAVDLE